MLSIQTLAFPLLIGSIAAFSGCAGKQSTGVVPVPRVSIQQTEECPAPVRPELPMLDGSLPFDHPKNVENLMERDDLLRAYIHGLESAVQCYERQAVNKNNTSEHTEVLP